AGCRIQMSVECYQSWPSQHPARRQVRARLANSRPPRRPRQPVSAVRLRGISRRWVRPPRRGWAQTCSVDGPARLVDSGSLLPPPSAKQAGEIGPPGAARRPAFLCFQPFARDLLLFAGGGQVQCDLEFLAGFERNANPLMKFSHPQMRPEAAGFELDGPFERGLRQRNLQRLGQRDAGPQIAVERLLIELNRLAQETDCIIDVITLECIDPPQQ